jgi:sarcosine oxidase, subunit gamma
MQALNITDLSELVRYGVKGPQASNWLTKLNITLPTTANTWLLNQNSIVLRLGSSEFLIEDQKGAETCAKLAADLLSIDGVYKVPRVDASYLLAGSNVNNLLSEICALDLSEPALQDNGVVMTQVAGISATILRQSLNGEIVYRLWCDGTYGTYMQHTLLEIASELNGL